ncbi:MAG TPA: hypothetical protein PLS31_02650, partial [Candidatus Sumerlaeota bacterium]|nr:hypothetical protein [Candidatus Sumerlaeota bacterium]
NKLEMIDTTFAANDRVILPIASLERLLFEPIVILIFEKIIPDLFLQLFNFIVVNTNLFCLFQLSFWE